MPEAPADPRIFRFGIFELRAGTGELRRDGTLAVRLREQSLQVLLSLLERPREVITRDELRQRLWPADTFVDFDHGLNTAINQLRNTLGDSAANPRFIQTIPRRGYRFIAPVEVDAAAQPLVPDAAAAAKPVPESKSILAGPGDLPAASTELVRPLFALIQVMYLSFYVVALARLPYVEELLLSHGREGFFILAALIVTAAVGIPIRFYLFSAAAFNYEGLVQKFTKLFTILLVLDELWALSPFLAVAKIGFGLAIAVSAALVYLPFSQRILLLMAAPGRPK